MPDFDAAAKAKIDAGDFAPEWIVWIDFLDDPLRATTYGKDVPFAGTGDPDLDGHTFVAFDGRFLNMGEISNGESGSETLSMTLSGLRGIDRELMAQIRDRTKWHGRTVRVWERTHDATGTVQHGGIAPFFTGYASRVRVIPGKRSQTIILDAENYLATFNDASNRSYLNQKDYDPADNSAQATLAAANMGRGVGRGSGGGGTSPSGFAAITNGLLVDKL